MLLSYNMQLYFILCKMDLLWYLIRWKYIFFYANNLNRNCFPCIWLQYVVMITCITNNSWVHVIIIQFTDAKFSSSNRYRQFIPHERTSEKRSGGEWSNRIPESVIWTFDRPSNPLIYMLELSINVGWINQMMWLISWRIL